MELKEFVKEVLVQLSEAVVETQEKVEKFGAIVNPSGRMKGGSIVINKKTVVVIDISFEVVLTNTGTNENASGIGVYLGSIGIGGKEKIETRNEGINRINFSIPIALPSFDAK